MLTKSIRDMVNKYFSPWPNSPSSTGEPRGTHNDFFYDRSHDHRIAKEQSPKINNMKCIIIAFTLKGQDFKKIEQQLTGLGNKLNNKGELIVCIHGFMPRKTVEENGWPADVSNALDWIFPVQLNMYNGKPLREEMVIFGKAVNAVVYVIGEVKEGVQEEVNLYRAAGLTIEYLPIV